MDRYFVYVLYSASLNSFYIGQTLNVDIRLEEHLQHLEANAFTKRANDWIIYYQLECISRQQAILVERHIKSMKSSKYLKNLAEFPDIGRKLLERFE